MKSTHILFIATMLLVASPQIIVLAQSPPLPTSYFFCALNGTCYNEANNDNPKVTLIHEEYSPQQIINETDAFIEAYPQYNVVAPASMLYNCHGFAYSVFQGGRETEN